MFVAVSKIRKNIYRSEVQATFSLTVISDFYMPFIPNKTTLCLQDRAKF